MHSRPRSTLLTVGLCLCVLLAGCSVGYSGTPASPTATDRTGVGSSGPASRSVTLHLPNGGDGTHRVEAWLLDRGAERARVTFADGTTVVRDELTAVSGVRLFLPSDATGVRPLGVGAAARANATVGPETADRVTFESVPPEAALFVVVFDDGGQVRRWVTATCGAGYDLRSLTVPLGGHPRARLHCTLEDVP